MKTIIVILVVLLIGFMVFTFIPKKKKIYSKGEGVPQSEEKEPKTKEGDVIQ